MKKILLVMLTFIMAQGLFAIPLFASGDIREVKTLGMRRGEIKGANAEYSFTIPSIWQTYVTAQREKLKSRSALLDKVIFSCDSVSGIYKPKVLMTLYVYDKNKWSDSLEGIKLFSSQDYVFAYVPGEENSFYEENDRMTFRSRFNLINSPDKVKALIVISDDQKLVYENRVFVNGVATTRRVIIEDKKELVPLRFTAELLGFEILWDSKTTDITVKGTSGSEQINDVIVFDKTGKYESRGIRAENINGTTYVSTMYFMRVLKKSIEIDSDNNVFIY